MGRIRGGSGSAASHFPSLLSENKNMNELETYIKNQKVIISGLCGELEPMFDDGEDEGKGTPDEGETDFRITKDDEN